MDAETLESVRAIGRGILALRVDSVRREPDPGKGFQEICLRADAAKRPEHCLRREGRVRPGTGMSLLSHVQYLCSRCGAHRERERVPAMAAELLEPAWTAMVRTSDEWAVVFTIRSHVSPEVAELGPVGIFLDRRDRDQRVLHGLAAGLSGPFPP